MLLNAVRIQVSGSGFLLQITGFRAWWLMGPRGVVAGTRAQLTWESTGPNCSLPERAKPSLPLSGSNRDGMAVM